MFNWLNYLSTEHRETFNRETEEAIIVREAYAKGENRLPLHQVALLALGQRLSTWGDSLQNRYNDAQALEFERETANDPC